MAASSSMSLVSDEDGSLAAAALARKALMPAPAKHATATPAKKKAAEHKSALAADDDDDDDPLFRGMGSGAVGGRTFAPRVALGDVFGVGEPPAAAPTGYKYPAAAPAKKAPDSLIRLRMSPHQSDAHDGKIVKCLPLVTSQLPQGHIVNSYKWNGNRYNELKRNYKRDEAIAPLGEEECHHILEHEPVFRYKLKPSNELGVDGSTRGPNVEVFSLANGIDRNQEIEFMGVCLSPPEKDGINFSQFTAVASGTSTIRHTGDGDIHAGDIVVWTEHPFVKADPDRDWVSKVQDPTILKSAQRIHFPIQRLHPSLRTEQRVVLERHIRYAVDAFAGTGGDGTKYLTDMADAGYTRAETQLRDAQTPMFHPLWRYAAWYSVSQCHRRSIPMLFVAAAGGTEIPLKNWTDLIHWGLQKEQAHLRGDTTPYGRSSGKLTMDLEHVYNELLNKAMEPYSAAVVADRAPHAIASILTHMPVFIDDRAKVAMERIDDWLRQHIIGKATNSCGSGGSLDITLQPVVN
jgi:hypothetical protein